MMSGPSVMPVGANPFDSTLSDSNHRVRVSRDVSPDTVDGREW